MLSALDSEKRFPLLLMKYYLEVEDDCPNESKNDGRFPVHNVAGVDVHQLDLRRENIFDKIPGPAAIMYF